MTFKNAIRTCLREKYFTLDGRASRSEYWFFWLFYFIATIAFGILDQNLFPAAALGPLSVFFALGTFIPLFTAGIRRLHDRDLSGWWMLIVLVPVIGSLCLLVIYVLPGTDGPNRFGPNPRGDGGPPDRHDEGDDVTAQSSIPRVGRK